MLPLKLHAKFTKQKNKIMENTFQEEEVTSPVATTEEAPRETEQDVESEDTAFEEELDEEGEFEEADELTEETDATEEA